MGFYDCGEIVFGKKVDFLLLNDLESFDINMVYKFGKVVFEKGEFFYYLEKIEEFLVIY